MLKSNLIAFNGKTVDSVHIPFLGDEFEFNGNAGLFIQDMVKSNFRYTKYSNFTSFCANYTRPGHSFVQITPDMVRVSCTRTGHIFCANYVRPRH